jgi:hypothetical protein
MVWRGCRVGGGCRDWPSTEGVGWVPRFSTRVCYCMWRGGARGFWLVSHSSHFTVYMKSLGLQLLQSVLRYFGLAWRGDKTPRRPGHSPNTARTRPEHTHVFYRQVPGSPTWYCHRTCTDTFEWREKKNPRYKRKLRSRDAGDASVPHDDHGGRTGRTCIML